MAKNDKNDSMFAQAQRGTQDDIEVMVNILDSHPLLKKRVVERMRQMRAMSGAEAPDEKDAKKKK